jgi:hypothetical protein
MCTTSVFQPTGRHGATGYATASGARAVADTSLHDGADAGTNATAGDVVEAAAATDAGNAVAAPDADEHADAVVTSLEVHDGAAMDVERGDDAVGAASRGRRAPPARPRMSSIAAVASYCVARAPTRPLRGAAVGVATPLPPHSSSTVRRRRWSGPARRGAPDGYHYNPGTTRITCSVAASHRRGGVGDRRLMC